MVSIPGDKLGSVNANAVAPTYQNPNVPSAAFGDGGKGLKEAGKNISGFSDQLAQLAITQIR